MKNTNILSELYKGLIGVKSWLSRGFVLILALFTLAVGQMWGNWSRTIYFIPKDSWVSSGYSFKVNERFDGSQDIWRQANATNTYKTVNGKPVYSCTVEAWDNWASIHTLQIQAYSGNDWKEQVSAFNNWNNLDPLSNKLYNCNSGDNAGFNTFSFDNIVSGGYIYFDNSTTSWSSSNYTQFVIGHASFYRPHTMTKVADTHTKLYYLYLDGETSHTWDDATYSAVFCATSEWGEESKAYSNIQAWAQNYTNTLAVNYSNQIASGSSYLYIPASANNNAALSRNSISDYTALNNAQTVYKYTSSGGTTPASYTAQNVNSGTVTISAYKMTGNGTASNTSNSATISDAATTSASKDAAYTGEVTLTASANTGYTFVGWFESTSATTPISTETEYTYNAPSSTKAIYARFKSETTNNVTISYKCGDGIIHSNVIEAVGVTTHRNITAPAISGFSFSGWTVGGGLNNHTGNTTTNPIEITTKASGSYTLTANYTCDWELRGSMNGWESGYSMTAINSTSVYAEVTLDANTNYQFKFKNGSTWYGVDGTITNITYSNKATARAMTNINGSNDDQTMTSAGAGTYRFTWDITNKKVTITYPTSYTVALEVGTVKGNSRTPAMHLGAADGTTLSNGDYVASGSTVYFWVANSAASAPKDGYEWWGFYDNAAGKTPTQLGNNTVSQIHRTITENTTVYAVFGEIMRDISTYNNGDGIDYCS